MTWRDVCLIARMRITLNGEDVAVTDQLQAYAEYRIFTSIARYASSIRVVKATLRQYPSDRNRFLCLVSVELGPSSRITSRARGLHPNSAIDRAADRMASELSRRVPQHVSS